MPVTTTNPAGRLYTILEDAKKKDQNKKTYVVWGEILNVDTSAAPFQAAALLHALLAEIKASIESVEGLDKDLYLRHLPKLTTALGPDRFALAWSETEHLLTDTLMTWLEFCAAELSKHHQEQEIEPEQLQQLQKDVEEFINDIVGSELDDALKHFVLQQLETIRKAILDYRLRGAAALREALERTTGALIINRQAVEENRDTPELSRFGKIFASLRKLVQIALEVKQLAEATEPLIKMLPSAFGP